MGLSALSPLLPSLAVVGVKIDGLAAPDFGDANEMFRWGGVSKLGDVVHGSVFDCSALCWTRESEAACGGGGGCWNDAKKAPDLEDSAALRWIVETAKDLGMISGLRRLGLEGLGDGVSASS
jgi:hypothetical protein